MPFALIETPSIHSDSEGISGPASIETRHQRPKVYTVRKTNIFAQGNVSTPWFFCARVDRVNGDGFPYGSSRLKITHRV
jgi:hypothetical protein